MTYTDDFVPVEDSALEGPSYPVAFGIEMTPKVQGIALAVLGVVGAIALFTRVVSPVQQQKNEIEQRIADKELTLANQAASLQRVEEVKAELDRVLTQREGIYSLLGDPSSFDTLLLDINQQIEKSNASIAGAIAGNLSASRDAAALASVGLTQPQIDRIVREFATDPVFQRWAFTSELFRFDPLGLSAPVGNEYGPELNGKLERQIVQVNFRALFNQGFADLPEGAEIEEEELNRSGVRPLGTSFTMEVLVPIGDPREPPVPPAPAEPAEGEEGAEGEEEGGEEAPAEEG